MLRNKWFLRFMIVGTWAFLLSSCTSMSEKKAESKQEGALHFQIGVNYLVKGNIEMAYFELGKAARLMPKDPDVHFALGTVHAARKDYSRALEEYKLTIRLDPEYADAYNNIGFVYFKLEQWDKAIEYCRKALNQISYQTPEKALTIIGDSYYRKGDNAKAIENLKRALGINPDEPRPANTLAMIYLEAGNLGAAKDILTELIGRHPNYPGAHLNLGIAYYKERDFRAAKKEFEIVLNLAEKNSEDSQLARGYLDLID